MNYTSVIENAIELASAGNTKLSNDILELPGMSSKKGRSLLNYLVFDGCKYLEIGVYRGSTFASALYGNSPALAYAIDNWSWSKDPANAADVITVDTFKPIIEKHVPDVKFTIVEKDSFAVTPEDLQGNTFNVYFYDGNHSCDSQHKAITHYLPFLENEFILIVDDIDWGCAMSETRAALKARNVSILHERTLSSDSARHGPNGDWWFGYYIAHCKKQ